MSITNHTFRSIVHITLAVLLFGLLFLYIGWQARFLITGPTITITEVPPIFGNERIITLAGKTTNITRITLNGRQIFTDESGVFREHVVLETGYTITTLEATDRFGRKAVVQHPFIYTPASLATNTID